MPCKPTGGNIDVGKFEKPSLNASVCEFSIKIPIPTFDFALPTIPLPSLPIPVFSLSLTLSCSLDAPIDVSGGLDFGGGRFPCFDEDPDDAESDAGSGSREVNGV